MTQFPLFLTLKNRPVLVVGGGKVALRKVRKLLPYGPDLTVVAPDLHPDLNDLPVRTQARPFRLRDLTPAPAMVIAATDDQALNRRIAFLCRHSRIPVNVVDDPAACTFLFPALIRRGKLSAGVTTGGASPSAAAHYKTVWQSQLPDSLEDILDWLESRREDVKGSVPVDSRPKVFHNLWEACVQKGGPLTENQLEILLKEGKLSTGRVTLVGAGCGKADLITVRGLNALRTCQAVVYDDLIDPALLEAVPESAQRHYVGKRAGRHAMAQEEINGLLLTLAAQGLVTVRLKGGDPFLFGRGGEELQFLTAAGIPWDVIPGIPSALGIPAEYGIPVTHRGVSRGVHIVTGHTAQGVPDLTHLANINDTLVFLMGLGNLEAIAAGLISHGKDPATPAAVLSGGNSPHPAQVYAPLCQLAEAVRAANVQAPAIIVVGEVTAFPESSAL